MPHLTWALIATSFVTLGSAASAAPVLRAADVRIAFSSPVACEVTMTVTVDGATEIEHRVDAPPSPATGMNAAGIELLDVSGARRAGDLRTIGRTQALFLQPGQPSYGFRYRARLPEDRAYRCPIWLPAVPADGQSRAVVLHVALPPGTSPGRSMPALAWDGPDGVATLGHLPAFVHVPFARHGDDLELDIGRLMDIVAITVFAGATALWIWRRKRDRRSEAEPR